ncbi:hypothetical protein [Erythrobacter dokdonensis]|uniref:Uncharacterized protein n=1 Tax=Erythrobacter dokdonensis DSW-74 TaxID=1300349 RepID=A0A1A7BEQ8_9SPHN|nr:hypothetical protein [Erythrobacter dokdonensis]OBV10969.1 hypothetical protein I603_1377 [Erythrobacter dokdonensis DSW-74]
MFVEASLAATVALAGLAPSHATMRCAEVQEIAAYPAPAFLENLWVEPSGRVLFTSYLAKEIVAYEPGRSAATFAPVDGFPISILPLASGWLVAAHGEPFTAGPGFTATNRLLVLDADGTLLHTIAAPQGRFLNGMAMLADGSVLVADSILGRIWRLDIASGSMTVWLDDPALGADPAGKDLRPRG